MSNLKSVLLVALLTALTLPGSVQVSQAEAPAQASPDALTIGLDPWPGYGLLFIAEAQGFFQQEGVEVELKLFNTAAQSQQAFAEKRLDGVASVLSDAIAQSAAGVPLQVVWLVDVSVGGDVLVSKSIGSLADLVGKRIGASYGSFGQVFTVTLLERAGLKPGDYTIVNLSANDVPSALEAGIIDAGHTFNPYLQAALWNGATVIGSSADVPGVIIDIISFQQASIDANPDRIQRFIRAISAAQSWWVQYPQEGNALVAEKIGLHPDDLSSVLQTLRLYSAADNRNGMDPNSRESNSAYLGAQYANTAFLQAGLIDQAVDVQTILDPSFVQSLQQ